MVFKYVRPRTTRFFDHAHFHADVPSKNNIQHVKKRVEHSVSNCKCDPSELGSVLDHMTRGVNHGSSGLDVAAVKVKNELIDLWTYAGYGNDSSSSYLLQVPHPPLQIPLQDPCLQTINTLLPEERIRIPQVPHQTVQHHSSGPDLLRQDHQ